MALHAIETEALRFSEPEIFMMGLWPMTRTSALTLCAGLLLLLTLPGLTKAATEKRPQDWVRPESPGD